MFPDGIRHFMIGGLMRNGLFLAFFGLAATTAIGFIMQGGCGTAVSAILLFCGWKATASLLSPQFADGHVHAVSVVSAVISSLCVTLLLMLVGTAARKRGYLLSGAHLAIVFCTGSALCLALIFLAFPIHRC